MWTRTATAAAVSLCAVFAMAGCDAVSGTSDGVGTGASGTATPGGPTPSGPTPGGSTTTSEGPFAMPASACGLVEASSVERVAGRASVTLTPVGGSPTGSGKTVLTCAFTDGAVPVGLLTVDVRSADENKTAAEELDASVAGSLYKSSTTEPVSDLGDAAKYGTALSVGGLTYATVWTIRLGGGKVGDLSVTVASDTPETARPGIVDLARTALTRLGQPAASPTVTVNPETGP
ncbi:hypothetical protein [Pseudofrankia asymbiotica]|uniref:DUF3558 domain-containing protein n=1 Tax=Pseudofrankia asymbiotica TaxID=1834516 RepID=A0A1V2IHY5_9ACTN|nr:hypothetical protein [Pseudofrankia asymbiotica]ONH32812.1 hypothetical protein BL253_03530 [Pseudofrankia asymbiotica]